MQLEKKQFARLTPNATYIVLSRATSVERRSPMESQNARQNVQFQKKQIKIHCRIEQKHYLVPSFIPLPYSIIRRSQLFLGVIEFMCNGVFSALQSLSLKIEDDLRKAKTDPLAREPESEVARRAAERRLFGLTGASTQSDRIRQEMQRYASMRDPVLRYYLLAWFYI